MNRNRMRAALLAAALCLSLLCGCSSRPETPSDGGSAAFTPEPTATPLPTPVAVPVDVEQLLMNMTLEEKVGQLFFVRPDALDPNQTTAQIDDSGAAGVTEMSVTMGNMLVRYPVGGVVLFDKNIRSPQQLTAFIDALQAASKTPLFIAVDEEGGIVTRLAGNPAFELPGYESAAAVGAAGEAAAEKMGSTIGAYLKRYGFSMDFAPVADVSTNPANPVIRSRAFSSDPEQAALMAGAMAEGLSRQGIIPTFKHFPGHGDTSEDSHLAVAVTNKTRAQLRQCEWIPYKSCDLTGCAVMVGHIAVPEITGDLTPASLSPELVTDCLRGELGFSGLVITDSLAMQAVTRTWTPEEAAVKAVLAGCDVLLMSADLSLGYNGVLDAVRRGVISTERLDESVRRILEYKVLAGLITPA